MMDFPVGPRGGTHRSLSDWIPKGAMGPSESVVPRDLNNDYLLAQILLVGFFFFTSLIVLGSGFLQKGFYSPSLLGPLLLQVAAVMLGLSFLLLLSSHLQKWAWIFLICISTLTNGWVMTHLSWNQPLNFFAQVITIIIAGLIFQKEGSYLVGLSSLILFNWGLLVSPQVVFANVGISIFLNNLALALTTLVGAQLTEYFEVLGFRLQRAESDLAEIKNIHEQVLAHIPSAVITIYGNNQVIQANAMARSFVGELGAENDPVWVRLIDQATRAPVNEMNQKEFVWEGEPFQKRILRCEIVEFQLKPSEEMGKIILLSDVSHLRELEMVLRNQEKLAAVGKLAAGIAHEIRNPLASISGSVQLLSSQAENDEDKRLFKIVIKETDRLNLMISEFLDYAKPLPQPTDKVDLSELLSEVLELLAHNGKLRSDVEKKLEIVPHQILLGFKDKLKQALLNILINAYQAMDKTDKPVLILSLKSEVSAAASIAPVVSDSSLRAVLLPQVLVLRIRDNGMGMSEETKKRLFEPFYTTKSQGTGLGLAVTHKIFEGHGASLMVESQLGLGTEFVIKFNRFGILPKE